MHLALWSFVVGGALLVASGCSSSGGDGPTSSSGGPGGASTTTGGPSSSSSSGGGGGGGGAGGSSGLVPTGYHCSGATPGIAAVVTITNANCTTGSTCHSQMSAAATMYDMLVNRIAEDCTDGRLMVAPGDPEHSFMIDKITGTNLCSSPRMPLNGTPLPDADIQTIYDWICSGAPEQ